MTPQHTREITLRGITFAQCWVGPLVRPAQNLDFYPYIYIQNLPRLWPEKDLILFSGDDGLSGPEPWALPISEPIATPRLHRADPNSSGTTDLSDAIAIFGYLFLGADSPTCLESADVNNDGTIDISDGIALLNWLFTGGSAPAAPGPADQACGLDPDAPGSPGDLGCNSYTGCN